MFFVIRFCSNFYVKVGFILFFLIWVGLGFLFWVIECGGSDVVFISGLGFRRFGGFYFFSWIL